MCFLLQLGGYHERIAFSRQRTCVTFSPPKQSRAICSRKKGNSNLVHLHAVATIMPFRSSKMRDVRRPLYPQVVFPCMLSCERHLPAALLAALALLTVAAAVGLTLVAWLSALASMSLVVR